MSDMLRRRSMMAAPARAAISDGIVVKARDANGRATSADFYGETIHIQQFYCRTRTDGHWIALNTIALKNNVTAIGKQAFYACGALVNIDLSTVETISDNAFQDCYALTDIDLSSLTSIGAGAFLGCVGLRNVYAPLLRNCSKSAIFRGCTSLETVQLGSVGNGVTAINGTFYLDTQANLTITIFTTGSFVNTALTNTRNGATNATIIIKASEATTYNGVSYAAGETMITSTP